MSSILFNRRHIGGAVLALRDFCIVAQGSLSVTFTKRGSGSLSCSMDDGATWTNVVSGQPLPNMSAGDKIYFRGSLVPNTAAASYRDRGIGTFTATGHFSVKGGILSLIKGNGWSNTDEIPYRAFCSLFYDCINLTDASELVVPSGETMQEAFDHAFYNCSNLIASPSLPSSVVGLSSYYGMFTGCSNLHRIEVGFTSWAGDITLYWVRSVSNSGKFYCPATLPIEYGDSRIPIGWQVVTL